MTFHHNINEEVTFTRVCQEKEDNSMTENQRFPGQSVCLVRHHAALKIKIYHIVQQEENVLMFC